MTCVPGINPTWSSCITLACCWIQSAGVCSGFQFSSVAQSCPTLCDPMDCSTPAPRACSNSRPSSQWCHPTISSSVVLFSSCLQSFPASECFLMSRLFASGSWGTKCLRILLRSTWHLLVSLLLNLQSWDQGQDMHRDVPLRRVRCHSAGISLAPGPLLASALGLALGPRG